MLLVLSEDSIDEEFFCPDRVALLLKHFSEIEDEREPWRVAYPLNEVLLLVVLGSIAACDDFELIVAWGEDHLEDLRRFAPFDHGVPCARWLGLLLNRIDNKLFKKCFESWIAATWPDRPEFIAIDGKTSRRSHDRRKGVKALHTLSAYATRERLVLAQLSVPEKTNEITAIPELLDELAETGKLKGAMVTIDAMGCQAAIAEKIVAHRADYVLALKGNQSTLEKDVEDYFQEAPAEEVVSKTTVEKGHGRLETRTYMASANTQWLLSDRRHPGETRFTSIATIIKVEAHVEHLGAERRTTSDTRLFISSAPLDIERIAKAVRGHWGVESMHWLLDVEFQDDLSRLRSRHGAKNMAVVRRFALGLVRANKTKGSVKRRRRMACWNPRILQEILQIK